MFVVVVVVVVKDVPTRAILLTPLQFHVIKVNYYTLTHRKQSSVVKKGSEF